ncbi:hypothetical protein [Tahibacter harae]|uniref:Uncharacterized protein n=1 Tax=Tahibacter harae TaxID=2963937 RepID=A0ABT1QT19_9GAMM|nr:hypothetical protein [Tahibacter harae]MCQ4165424.1 hypothetical protein [Tahibacter harae]
MNKLSHACLLALALGALSAAVPALAGETPAMQTWTAFGGDLGFIWNEDLLRDLGVSIKDRAGVGQPDARGFAAVPLSGQTGLSFAVTRTNFDHFTEGRLSLRGGFRLRTPDGELSLIDAALQPRAGDAQTLDLVDSQGRTWFYLDKLMYAVSDDGRVIDVQTMDLRLHPDLAARLGKPQAADWAVAQLRMNLDVRARNGEYIRVERGTPVWPGMPVPEAPGQTYQADVFMLSFSAQFSRCTSSLANPNLSCDGPGGATDGYAVFTPSSTLRNNVNNGTPAVTVPGDPNGTSSALYTADVAWYRKFTAARPPYDNDQHPNLIWNIYRIDSAGRIEQIGRSGMKHAFVTTNGGCASGPGSGGSTGSILGRSCSDTYGTGNNDSNNDLGPRSELVPNTVQWGRCGSIFDKGCDLVADASNGNTNYSQRLIVRESQLTQPGSTYLFESWYIVRDDINIYNTMSTKPVTFSFSGSGPWSIGNGTPTLLGPAINRWMDPASSDPNKKNVEIDSPEGHARVAVAVTALGKGQWRYDYAVMNLDFARARTSGTDKYSDDADPQQRFRVIHNMGFDRFSVPLPAGASAATLEFSDGDLDADNDWSAAIADGRLTWSAPANPAPPADVPAVRNTLDWGTLYRFSFVSNVAPQARAVDLHVAEPGTPEAGREGFKPAHYSATVLGPEAPDALFADDFQPPE